MSTFQSREVSTIQRLQCTVNYRNDLGLWLLVRIVEVGGVRCRSFTVLNSVAVVYTIIIMLT